MIPWARALSPMNRERYSTVTPGHAVSTTKALIFFVCGSRAITTNNSASVPFVHQSFSPLSTYASPSHSAVVERIAGSEQALTSVSANAEIAQAAQRGRYFCFYSVVLTVWRGYDKMLN